jgi:hypothetical protein
MAALAMLSAAPVAAQAPPAPADFPHDMSTYGCSHRDGPVCDNIDYPPPEAIPMVGTWARVSILRNNLPVQPPEASLNLMFAPDGHWMMMEFPPNRPKVNKPLEQQTPAELYARFGRMNGGWGTYTNYGMVNYRRHINNLGPGGGSIQERGWHFDGHALVLDGTGPNHSPYVSFRKAPKSPLANTSLVGSWERTSYRLNGQIVTGGAPERFLAGADGWFQAAELPEGRRAAQGVALENYTTAQWVAAWGGTRGSRGTWNASANQLVRRHIADVDPNLEGKMTSGTYTKTGADSFTWTGTDAEGRSFTATYVRMKPFDVYAPLVRNPPAGGGGGGVAAPQ